MDHLISAFNVIKNEAGDPRTGVGEEIFHFLSSLTPMVNVDLLIRDPTRGTLLTWRSDQFYGPGWHLPGGVLRFKESPLTRVKLVAQTELGVNVAVMNSPCRVESLMTSTRDIRGHFISMLYQCSIDGDLDQRTEASSANPESGQWKWHKKAPQNLLSVHSVFRDTIDDYNIQAHV